jgi:integrase
MSDNNDNEVLKSRYCQYEGNSKRITEFLGYGNKESTNEAYMRNLGILENFIKEDYKCELDSLLEKLENNKLKNGNKVVIDVYRFLASYNKYLVKLGNQPNTIKNRINTAKALIITTTQPTISIDPRKFRYYVKIPKVIKKQKKGLGKETTIELINGSTNNPRLRVIMWFLAATSCRIGETLLLRISDLHLDGKPNFGLREPFLPYISIRGEITKTGQDRTVLLTSEIAKQLKLWIARKYKTRNHTIRDDTGKIISTDKNYKPEMHPDDFLFMNINHDYRGNDAARFVYRNLVNELHGVLEDLGLNQMNSNGQYAITLHKFRMGVRTRISDLGFKDSKEFSDFYMGHDTSAYYQPTDDDYKKYFMLCQNELTYFDQAQIQKSYGSIETRMDKIEVDEIADLRKQIKHIQQESREREERLLSLMVKESITGKPVIPKENLDLVFSGKFNSIPFPVSNRYGKDIKNFHISKDLESIKNNHDKEAMRTNKLLKPVEKGKNIVHFLKDPPEEFL